MLGELLRRKFIKERQLDSRYQTVPAPPLPGIGSCNGLSPRYMVEV